MHCFVVCCSNGGVVYSYNFNKNPAASKSEKAGHGSDFAFHIGFPLLLGAGDANNADRNLWRRNITFTEDEVALSRDVVTYFSNFAYSGYVLL